MSCDGMASNQRSLTGEVAQERRRIVAEERHRRDNFVLAVSRAYELERDGRQAPILRPRRHGSPDCRVGSGAQLQLRRLRQLVLMRSQRLLQAGWAHSAQPVPCQPCEGAHSVQEHKRRARTGMRGECGRASAA